MQLPLIILRQFTKTYNGVPAARVKSISEAKNLEAALRQAGKSYKTKMLRSKQRGKEFVVMLLDGDHVDAT